MEGLPSLELTLEKNIHRIFTGDAYSLPTMMGKMGNACLFCVRRWGGQMFVVALEFENLGENINRYPGEAHF